MSSFMGFEILGGYSLLPADKYMISYMNQGGSVNWDKLNIMLQRGANAGASYVRDFLYWSTNHEGWRNHLKPFWRFGDGSNVTWNDRYFTNWKNIFMLMATYNLTPVICLFNGSEARVGGPNHFYAKENSPWREFNDYFYGADARATREKWIDKIIECANAAGIRIWAEIINEPKATGAVDLIFESIVYLVERHDFPLDRIVTGWDIFRKEKESDYAASYRKFREMFVDWYLTFSPFLKGTIKEKEDYIEEQIIKGSLWSTMHGCTPETVKKYFGPSPAGLTLRNQIYSTDGASVRGERLSYGDGYDLAVDIYKVKAAAIRKGKVMISMLIGKESKYKDPYAALTGACNFISKVIDLPNRGKFPEPLPLPEWLKATSPEPIAPEIPPVNPEPIPDEIFTPPREKPWFRKHWRWVVGIASGLVGVLLVLFAPPVWRLIGAAQFPALIYLKIIK